MSRAVPEANPLNSHGRQLAAKKTPTPLTDAALYATVGVSLYWTAEQHAQARANLESAAAERGLTVADLIAEVRPRPQGEWPVSPQGAL